MRKTAQEKEKREGEVGRERTRVSKNERGKRAREKERWERARERKIEQKRGSARE